MNNFKITRMFMMLVIRSTVALNLLLPVSRLLNFRHSQCILLFKSLSF